MSAAVTTASRRLPAASASVLGGSADGASSSHWLRADPILLGTMLASIGLGAIMIASSSVAVAEGRPLLYFWQHLGALSLGTAGLIVALVTPIAWWQRFGTLLLIAAFGLLAGVLVPGVGQSVNGAARWIELGPVSFQASEPARLLLLIYLAGYAVRRHQALSATFSGLARPMILLAAASALLLMEPDLSAAVVLLAAGLGLLFAAGARLRDCAAGVAAAGAAVVVLAMSEPYRLERFLSFTNPWADAQNTGYQVVNSLIAIGSGGWFGVGLGAGVQKLYYLPEPHTDFVFAVLAEELGLLGASLSLALLALLIFRAFAIGRRALNKDLPFHGLLATGIALLLGVQVAINIGVNTSLLPPTGLTLPLISYGRTSTVVCLFALGLLLRIARDVSTARGPASTPASKSASKPVSKRRRS